MTPTAPDPPAHRASDPVAAALRAAFRLGLRVPQDVEIMSVGNSTKGQEGDPALTTVGPGPIFDLVCVDAPGPNGAPDAVRRAQDCRPVDAAPPLNHSAALTHPLTRRFRLGPFGFLRFGAADGS